MLMLKSISHDRLYWAAKQMGNLTQGTISAV